MATARADSKDPQTPETYTGSRENTSSGVSLCFTSTKREIIIMNCVDWVLSQLCLRAAAGCYWWGKVVTAPVEMAGCTRQSRKNPFLLCKIKTLKSCHIEKMIAPHLRQPLNINGASIILFIYTGKRRSLLYMCWLKKKKGCVQLFLFEFLIIPEMF